jgi:AraC-like DNA-binding protein
MKAFLEQVDIGAASSIKAKTYAHCKLDVPLHYHPEHEIVLVVKGKGKLFLSEAETAFVKGDLFLIGGGIPHLFADDHTEEGEVVVIQFTADLFEHFKHLPEFHRAHLLLLQISKGIKVAGMNSSRNLLMSLTRLEGVEKFNKLSYLLDHIVRKGNYQVISQPYHKALPNNMASDRLASISFFLRSNYERNISIDEVADLVHLSKSSFCRFLKKETGKTFSRLLNETRIQFACKLLRETPLTATQVCYEVGFSNPAYFYRQFKTLQEVSPNEYKKYAGMN